MGASLVYRTFPWSDRATLQKATDSASYNDAVEHGSSYSGHWNMCQGLGFDEKKVFDSVALATDHLDDVLEKRGCLIAVPALQTRSPSLSVLNADSAYKELVDLHGKTQSEIWAYDSVILRRTKAAKSTFRTCPTCGSKLCVQYLRDALCPVCTHNLLRTASDIKHAEALSAKLASLGARKTARELVLYQKANPGKSPGAKVWVVGGLCAS